MALPVKLIGMNHDLMCQSVLPLLLSSTSTTLTRPICRYIEFVADRLLVSLGCDKIWVR